MVKPHIRTYLHILRRKLCAWQYFLAHFAVFLAFQRDRLQAHRQLQKY